MRSILCSHVDVQRLPPALRDRPLIVVCHTFPDCWRTPMDDLARR